MRRRGISLIEIVVVLTIVGILLAIGIPAIRQHEASQTLRTQTDQLVSALKLVHSGRISSRFAPGEFLTGLLTPGTNPPTNTPGGGLYQLEQVTGGQTQVGQSIALSSGVSVTIANGTDLSVNVPETCSALVLNTAQAGGTAVVFLPSGQLFSSTQPAQTVTITLSSGNVPTQTINITPLGSIAESP